MKKYILPFVGLLLYTGSSSAQTEVLNGIMRGKDYGVTYQLPKTEIKLTIQATRHSYKPGDFCRYAERYLRIKNVAVEPSTYWTLNQVETKVVGVPDSEHVYFVKLKDKTTAPLMELTRDGIVRSINLPYQPEEDVMIPATPVQSPAIDPRSYLTEEILLANSTAKMAELVAKEIYEIRESKNALVRGEADYMPKDGAQLKLMLDHLNLQEKAMTEMFTGSHTEETKTFTLQITPQEMQEEVVFRFSSKLGMVDKADLAGEPIYLSVHDLKTVNVPEPNEEQESKEKKLDGIAYRVPGRAKVALTYQQKKLFEGELPVTQFGTIEYLAPVLFNKNTVTQVLFDPSTGGLIKVERKTE